MVALGTTRHCVIYPLLTPAPVQLKNSACRLEHSPDSLSILFFPPPCLSSSFPSDKQSVIQLVLELHH